MCARASVCVRVCVCVCPPVCVCPRVCVCVCAPGRTRACGRASSRGVEPRPEGGSRRGPGGCQVNREAASSAIACFRRRDADSSGDVTGRTRIFSSVPTTGASVSRPALPRPKSHVAAALLTAPPPGGADARPLHAETRSRPRGLELSERKSLWCAGRLGRSWKLWRLKDFHEAGNGTTEVGDTLRILFLVLSRVLSVQ